MSSPVNWIIRLVTIATFATAIGVAAPAASFGAETVWWGNYSGNTVSHANLDGSGAGGDLNTTGASAPSAPGGVAFDIANGRVYWSNTGGKISYANIDGSGGGGDLNTTGATTNGPRGLAIDLAAGRVYWSNVVPTGSISYADLDGSGGGDLDTTGATVSQPNGVAIDPADNRIYWANWNATTGQKISYANLDGTGAGGDLSTSGATVNQPGGVAVDPAGGRIYWANETTSTTFKISYAELDGSGGGDLSTVGATVGNPLGVAIDPPANRIYWANAGGGGISYANLDGSGSGGDLDTTGATMNEPDFVALLRIPSATGVPSVSGGSQTGSVLHCSQGSWASDFVDGFLFRAPGDLSYQWSRNGADILGAHARNYAAPGSGAYRCAVTASNPAGSAGPQTSAPHPVSAPPPPPPTSLPPPPPAAQTPAQPAFSPAAKTKKCKKRKKSVQSAKKRCKRK